MSGRPLAESDAPFLRALFADPAVGPLVSAERRPWDAALAAEAAADYARHWRRRGWGLRLWIEGGRARGVAGFNMCEIGGVEAVEASFAFVPRAQGRGLAEEAMRAALDELRPPVVWAVIHADNAPSERLLRKLGFASAGALPAEGPEEVAPRARLLFVRAAQREAPPRAPGAGARTPGPTT
ncbi:GNAT family N-acetyltransferase [Oceanicella actignis]|uniref:GNAT family N-acetyltransferase n=1 Tax=Oceanicella actignis TaxID=1189325 RepID=UPI0011E74411|nr:GNAT family N-acetyltransferase [Oceanicella actignis]TYO88431.1 RimJ/RimL family protein N-acetyltransferase [Oceanicella actignis]